MAISRLPVFYKQEDYYFYPAWAYAIPAFILKVPVSLVESIAWTSISTSLIGYTPEASRLAKRCLASLPNWLKWGFWLSPLSYAEIGLTGNEFLAPRWLKSTAYGVSLGRRILMDRGLDFSNYFYWISVGALIGFILLLNIVFAIGLTIKKPPGTSRAIISRDKMTTSSGSDRPNSMDIDNGIRKPPQTNTSMTLNRTGRMVLPFTPLTISFQEVSYYVDTPAEMREQGYMDTKLQLLHNITGAFQPGVLSALMGVTGAGKTTLLDVLAGRKTGGVIEGDIRVGGYPKVQQTFARISGYCEQTDVHSPQLTAIPGIPQIKENYNPSTWILEATSTSMEAQLGVDFAQIYRDSSICKDNDTLVRNLSIPPPGTSDLLFPTQYPQRFWEQFKACLWKQSLSYWRSPSYNLVRIVFITISCIAFGALYWQQGDINHINDQQSLFTILGCMYGTTLFAGINNCQSVMPFVSIERSVVYRERFAGMYSPWAYSFAQVAMEIPYVFVQIVVFMFIAYPMIGYAWTGAKFFWFLYTMFCTLLYFIYLGMMMVSLTPNIQVASILASMFYTIQNLMSGFIVPAPQIPKWWIWLYYISPMSWTLNVFFTTQFGYEDNKNIEVFGETKPVATFVRDYFDFRRELLPLAAVVLAAYPIIFAILFGYNISKLNFQRR
ncbi:hypothetical protein EJB05_52394, partial [Eragrostis curvula]